VASDVWGYKKNLTMDELLPIAHPDDVKAFEKNFKEALDGLRTYELTHPFTRQNTGEVRFVNSKGIVSFDKQGKPYKVLGTVQDITERKPIEKELEEHRDNLETRVKNRTYDLTKVNEKLKTEMVRRKKIEHELVDREANLEEAQRIANLGRWQLDIARDKVVWSEELYNMYGFDPSHALSSYSEFDMLFTPHSGDKLYIALFKIRDT
jgi:PAS domain S-box-containing protein